MSSKREREHASASRRNRKGVSLAPRMGSVRIFVFPIRKLGCKMASEASASYLRCMMLHSAPLLKSDSFAKPHNTYN